MASVPMGPTVGGMVTVPACKYLKGWWGEASGEAEAHANPLQRVKYDTDN